VDRTWGDVWRCVAMYGDVWNACWGKVLRADKAEVRVQARRGGKHFDNWDRDMEQGQKS
jgi:hypothetical protein